MIFTLSPTCQPLTYCENNSDRFPNLTLPDYATNSPMFLVSHPVTVYRHKT